MSTSTTGTMLTQLHASARQLGRPVTLMEVCGTHTMAAFESGLRALLPANVQLISGPGCPVCVTVDRYIDQAVAISFQPATVVATFGDMMRVPGSQCSLEQARAAGGTVEVVYSPSDALELARRRPDQQVVFLGIGFETTTPAVAWCVRQAAAEQRQNFTVLCGHKRVLPAMLALVSDPAVALDGFLCPGHVSVIIGADAYQPLLEAAGIPCVVTGFSAADMTAGIGMLLNQLSHGRARVEIQYRNFVDGGGNLAALAIMHEVFEHCDAAWRGLGTIPDSGWRFRPEFAPFDAAQRYAELELPPPRAMHGCRCGDILRGTCRPPQCPRFGSDCTPLHPIGACMVSSEGTCAAYYKYGS